MDPGLVSFDVMYLQDTHRYAQIDSSQYVFKNVNLNIIIMSFKVE